MYIYIHICKYKNIHIFFCRCILHGLLGKFELCFLYFCLEDNSPRFDVAIREVPIDFSWFQKII